jgi:hypothetical protein
MPAHGNSALRLDAADRGNESRQLSLVVGDSAGEQAVSEGGRFPPRAGAGARPLVLLAEYVDSLQAGDACFCCGAALEGQPPAGDRVAEDSGLLVCSGCGAVVDRGTSRY